MYVLPITFLFVYFLVATVTVSGHFGSGSVPVVLNNVQCDGSESHLVNCTHLVTQNCSMLETAGVLCKPACQYNGQVNLYGGRSNNEGRVEILHE